MRALAAIFATLWLAGCGFGEGAAREGGAELRVTSDFGREELAAHELDSLREDETVMRALEQRHDVETRYGGKYVQAIDGLAGAGADGQRDWFFFVNGIEAHRGAADWELEPGDVIQWDHRAWGAAQRVPAIVGAYPEPFVSGKEGKRLPVRLECADQDDQACVDVKRALTEVGAPVSSAAVGTTGGGDDLVRVLVGAWDELREVRSVATLEEGPGASGVFARFTDGGRLELLGGDGEVVREADTGTGLVAATALDQQSIVWLVTGADEVGVQAAATALDPARLRNAFAVAATPDGVVKLPLSEEGESG